MLAVEGEQVVVLSAEFGLLFSEMAAVTVVDGAFTGLCGVLAFGLDGLGAAEGRDARLVPIGVALEGRTDTNTGVWGGWDGSPFGVCTGL